MERATREGERVEERGVISNWERAEERGRLRFGLSRSRADQVGGGVDGDVGQEMKRSEDRRVGRALRGPDAATEGGRGVGPRRRGQRPADLGANLGGVRGHGRSWNTIGGHGGVW